MEPSIKEVKAFVAGIARTTVDRNASLDGLLPGPFGTGRRRGG